MALFLFFFFSFFNSIQFNSISLLLSLQFSLLTEPSHDSQENLQMHELIKWTRTMICKHNLTCSFPPGWTYSYSFHPILPPHPGYPLLPPLTPAYRKERRVWHRFGGSRLALFSGHLPRFLHLASTRRHLLAQMGQSGQMQPTSHPGGGARVGGGRERGRGGRRRGRRRRTA